MEHAYRELYQKPTDGIPLSDIDAPSGNANKCLMFGSSGLTPNFPVTATHDGDTLKSLTIREANGAHTYTTKLYQYRITGTSGNVFDLYFLSSYAFRTDSFENFYLDFSAVNTTFTMCNGFFGSNNLFVIKADTDNNTVKAYYSSSYTALDLNVSGVSITRREL